MCKVSNEELFRSTLVEMESTYRKKNADYGNSFEEMYRKVGAIYPLIHLSEKLARIEQLTQSYREPRVTEESLRDSLLDLANYSVMWITELDKEHTSEETSDTCMQRVHTTANTVDCPMSKLNMGLNDYQSQVLTARSATRGKRYSMFALSVYQDFLSESINKVEEHMESKREWAQVEENLTHQAALYLGNMLLSLSILADDLGYTLEDIATLSLMTTTSYFKREAMKMDAKEFADEDSEI